MLRDGDADRRPATPRRVPCARQSLYLELARQRIVEECGVVGEMTVREFRTARVQLGPFMTWLDSTCPAEPSSMGLLGAYDRVDQLDYSPVA
jgi:hypothetical protein